MLIENNTLLYISYSDIIDGVFTAPDDVLYICDNFHCDGLTKIILPNVIEIGKNFLNKDIELKHIEIPKIEIIKSNFLFINKNINYIYMPNIKEIGLFFLPHSNIRFTMEMIRAIKGSIYRKGLKINKKDCIREINLYKFLHKNFNI